MQARLLVCTFFYYVHFLLHILCCNKVCKFTYLFILSVKLLYCCVKQKLVGWREILRKNHKSFHIFSNSIHGFFPPTFQSLMLNLFAFMCVEFQKHFNLENIKHDKSKGKSIINFIFIIHLQQSSAVGQSSVQFSHHGVISCI